MSTFERLRVLSKQNSEVLDSTSFMLTYQEGVEVVQSYEIHLSNALQGLPPGNQMTEIAESVSKAISMEKNVLTLFEANRMR